MALDFNASGRQVDHGSGTSLDDIAAGTQLMWCYVDDVAQDQFMFRKVPGHFRFTGSSDINVRRDRATSNISVIAPAANFSAWGTGKWVFCACVWDVAGGNTDQKVYIGDLTTPAAEPSSYTTQTAGSGAQVNDNTAVLQTCGGIASWYLRGDAAFAAQYNVALSESQIRVIQFTNACLAGCVLHLHYGLLDGTGTQRDFSGNANDGTLSGSPALIAHAPIKIGGRSRVFPAGPVSNDRLADMVFAKGRLPFLPFGKLPIPDGGFS